MPRIRDEYLDCSIYLYASEKDAQEGARSGGCGFLVGIRTTNLPNNVLIPYVVTNKHVVENGNAVIRMKTRDGKNSFLTTDSNSWRFHPAGDDLAVRVIRFDWMTHQYNYVPRNILLDKKIASSMKIGPGDETFAIGRFVNHEGKQQNLPTVRFGCIAQMPFEPIIQDTGFDQESFLVEARSISGYSGAPVFVYISVFSEREGIDDWYPSSDLTQFKEWGSLKAHGPWLLGVDWGHILDWEPLRYENGERVKLGDRKVRVRVNTGMMAVVPARKLAELLDEGIVAEERNEIVEALRSSQINGPIVPR